MKTPVAYSLTISLLVILFISGCSEDPKEQAIREKLETPIFSSLTEEQEYVDSLQGVRHFKDEWMLESRDSPLKEEDRERFSGLNYFPVDLQYVFRTRLHKYEDPEIITIGTTTGDDREAIRYGYIEFTIYEDTYRLHAYKFTAHQGTDLDQYIFIPFKDATSGSQTYSGGRYMDVQEEIPGVVVVDFNDAYNPYCVYNEAYSCPIPPRENHIDIAIEAGEKDFKL